MNENETWGHKQLPKQHRPSSSRLTLCVFAFFSHSETFEMISIQIQFFWKALESLPNPVQFIFHKSLEQRCVVQIGMTCGATKTSNLVRTTKVKEELYFCSKIWEYSSVLRLSCPSVCMCVVEILRWGKQQLQDQPVQNRAVMDGR